MNSECKFLIEIVKEASTLLNNHFEVFKKGEDGDLVTNLDFMIEKQFGIDHENLPIYINALDQVLS